VVDRRGKNRGRAIDANRILTDLLVNFRRIVHRGLVNYSGELWYREGLPSDVFRRLVVRKENETPLDRFSGDYEELMTYANFRDLADIIVGNQALKERLTVLEPRDGASLLDRLHELEEMRRSISSNRSASDEDAARLKSYFDEFRAALKRGKPAARKSSDRPSAPPRPRAESAPEEETLESIFEQDELAPPAPKPRPGRLVVKVSANGIRNATSGAETRPEAETPPSPRETVASEIGSMETPVTEVSTRPGPQTEDSKGPIEEAESIERSIRDEDDAAILKALHVEVTGIADGMLRRDPKHGHVVWEKVRRQGWFDANLEEYELQPLEAFYSLSDEFLEAYASGAKSSELKAILAEAGFSKMLLAMREMFLSSRSRA